MVENDSGQRDTSTPPAAPDTITHNGRPYAVVRGPGADRDTVREAFPGIGVIGSMRAWRGNRWARGVTWFAAANPTGEDGKAIASVDRLPSRRAALRWLLDGER